ncbi:protease3 [Moraxella lacunata]|uniref:Protease3 n=1 Tax=Moraxella lacunata TaxID=477 RepID=A0A378QDU8_MORLA|nr:pitrilysin family protein [Moraxella lacunata]STY98670.1 protease3 [Moraxella lacunata]
MKKIIALALFVIAHTALAEISSPVIGRLDNGLDYVILPLHDDKGRLEIRLRVNAGGIDESDTQAGVAHMVEHLVFRASDKHPDGVMNHLHDMGFVRARHYNAVTTTDSTTYLMTPPPKVGLDGSLSALSQMMFFAHITPDDLEKERHIITEEWRGGQGVSARMDEQRKAVIRAGSRSVRSPVIGTLDSITTMPAHELQAFYQTWYAPNNMNLLIVGDVDIDHTKAKIQEYFGSISYKPLPDRTGSYCEPTLSDRLTITELHDDKSGVSQVAYVLRLDESASRGDNDTARKNRLIDRFALTFITKRLQSEMNNLPNGIKSMVARKSDIGKHTVAIELFSSVDKDKHKDGLQEIFYQIKRLQDYPITQDELDEYKKDFQIQLDKAHAHSEDRDFAGWVQALVGTALVDKPYLPQKDIATLTQPLLDNLTAQDVQGRVHDWLSAPDRIVQYQAPLAARVTPISVADVEQMRHRANTATLAPPIPKPRPTTIDLPHVITTAYITHMARHGDTRTYTLSTGDRVLWLAHPSAKDKTYIRAVSTAGTQADGLGAWQSQLATGLIFQNTPDEFDKTAWDNFKKTHRLNLSAKQTAHELIVEMSSDNDKLNELMGLYHAQLYRTTIKDGLDDTKSALMSELAPTGVKQAERHRLDELGKLRHLPNHLPSLDELHQLDEDTLNHTWERMTRTPTTFYIVSNATPAHMGQFITLFANPNPPLTAFRHTATPLATSDTVKFAHHNEPRADVQLWTTTPHAWQGVDAMTVNLLKNITSDKLKLTLRDEKLGIYRLSFDTTLSPDTHRIESHLKFTTSPDKADEMIAHAKQVLANLPALITTDDINKAKSTFANQEKSRQNDPYTWLNRLALSDKQGDDLVYLNQVKHLDSHITLANLQRMAGRLYNPDSVQIWIDMPKE